jgi:RNA polymerase sigma-70 factor (ECF subfamily)
VATSPATTDESAPVELQLETHRRELTGYCYRMLGSGAEAEDAVQETMVRAWRSFDRFEGRSTLRSWLYRIATNVCLDMLKGPKRRVRPMDLGPASSTEAILGSLRTEDMWIEPIADGRVLPIDGDPAELVASRESIRLAFVAALQHLPPRQRAVLILREVLRLRATEVAELLDATVASVNSALQRARATLEGLDLESATGSQLGEEQRQLLARYVDAFERYDITALVALLHEEATFCMPPYDLWLQGPDEVARWLSGPGIGCEGSRMVATWANGCAALGSYRSAAAGGHEPFALQVIEVGGGKITAIYNFLGDQLFAEFGLPSRLDD